MRERSRRTAWAAPLAGWLVVSCTGAGPTPPVGNKRQHVSPVPHLLAPEGRGSARPEAEGAAPSAPLATGPRVAAMSAEEPYVLADDIRAREERAASELGRASTKTVHGVYLLVSPDAQGISTYAPVVERAVGAYMNDRFAKLPARAVSVYLFRSDGPYQAYCKKHMGGPCISVFGFYWPSTRSLVMNAGTGIGTLTHELVHPIVETDFPNAPTWLNEGIASLYEQPVFPREGEVHGAKNWRYRRIASALGSKSERASVSLRTLFTLSDTEFRADHEDLHYALARYTCQWLDEKKLLWPFYKHFREHYAEDPTGEASLAAVLGTPTEKSDPQWQTWLRTL